MLAHNCKHRLDVPVLLHRRFLARLSDMDRYLFYNSGWASRGVPVPVDGGPDVFFARRSVSV
jgi:hypothetical protein